MTNKNLSLGLQIDLATSGFGKLSQGIEEIKQAGVATDGLEKDLNQLSSAFDDIADQQRLISQFKKLKKESKELSVAIKSGSANTDKLKARKKELAAGLKLTRAAMDKAGISVQKLASKEKELEKQSKSAEKELEKLTDEAQRLKAIADAKITLGIDTDDKARKELDKVTAAYKKLEASGTLSSSELARASELHTNKVKELEAQLGKTRPTLSDLTAEFSKLASSGAAFAYIAKEAMQFEQAMAGVKKVVDGTPEEISSLGNQIKDLAQQLGIVPEKVADIAAAGGQLGIALNDLPKFVELAGQMAVAFDMTADEAANAAAKLSNVWQLPLDEVRSLADAINTLGNNTAAKEAEITAAMLRIGGNAKQFGLAAEQAAALADAMIALGKPPEVAATAINALLLKLQTAKTQGKAFNEALQSIGLSADQMAENISAAPQQALSDFLAKIGELDKQTRAVTLSNLFGAEYADDIALLTGSLGEYNKALDLTANKSKTTGALTKEFAAATETTEAALNRAQIALKNIASTLGDGLLPVISSAATGTEGMSAAIRSVIEEFPLLSNLTVILAGVSATTMALNTALKLMGKSGVMSFVDMAIAAKKTTTAIVAGEKSIGSFGNRLKLTKADAVVLGKQLASINGILSSIAAFEGGLAIGTWLREASETARSFGDELARGLAYLDAIFTDRTFEDVATHFETAAEAQRRMANASRDAADAAQLAATQEFRRAQQAKEQATAQARYIKDVAATYDSLKTSMQAMAAAGQKNTEHYRWLQQEISKLTPILAEHNKKIAESGKTLDESVTKIREYEQAWAAVGLSTSELLTGVTEAEQKIIDSTQTAIEGLQKTANGAEQTGQAIDRYLVQALDKIKTPEGLKQFIAELQALPQQTAQVQAAIAAANEKLWQHNETYKALSDSIAKATNAEQLKQYAAAVEQAYKKGELSIQQYKAQLDGIASREKALAESSKKTGESRAKSHEKVAKATQKATKATTSHTKATKDNTKAVHYSETAQANFAKAFAKSSKQINGTGAALANWMNDLRNSLKDSKAAMEDWNNAFAGPRVVNGVEGYIRKVEGAFDRAKKVQENYHKALDKSAQLTELLSRKTANGTVTMQDLDAAALHVSTSLDYMNDPSQLNNLVFAIADAKREMAELKNEAKETADAIHEELLDATENAIEKTKRKFDKRMKELQDKADAAVTREENNEYQRAMRDLQRLKDIELKKQREREAESERRQQPPSPSPASNTNGSGTSIPSGGGNTLVLQMGEKNVPVEDISDEVMNRISGQLRGFSRGMG